MADLAPTSAPPHRRFAGQLPPLEKLAWIVWALVVAGITVRVLVQGDARSGVYDVFLRAAGEWVDGHNTYAPEARYRYPPIATVTFVGFRAAGDLLGSLLWRWLNIAAYLGAVVWALRTGFPAALSRRAQAVALLLMVVPSLTSLNNGQANGIVAGGLIGAAVALQRQRHALAALLVTVPIAYKIFPIALAMVAGVLRPRRFLPWLLLGLAACAALPYLCQDADYVTAQYRELYALLRVEDRTGDPNDAYRDLRLVLLHLGTPIGETAYLALQALVGAAIAVLCLLGQRAGWPLRKTAAYMLALTTCWMLVLGFSTEKATYILATPILCWLIARAGEQGDRRQLWFFVGIYLLYLLPIFVPGSLRRGPVARSALPAATIALMAAIGWHGALDLVRSRRTPGGRR